MLPALIVSFYFGDGAHMAFIDSMAALLLAGTVLILLFRKKKLVTSPRESFVAVALCWIAISLFGALPPFLSGAIPNYIDALFEITAGFTTTGATILQSVENLPASILFWRSFTQWIGGMGVLLLTLAVLPAGARNAYNLVRSESTDLSSERIVPRIRRSSGIICAIYFALTLLETAMLLLCRLNLYDAVLHALATAGTGGFSDRNLSIGAFGSASVEFTVSVFMILFSVSFGLYYAVVTRKFRRISKNTELRVFLGLIVISTVLITGDLLYHRVFPTFLETVRHAFFQVSSLISSTAFSSTDYNLWPEFSRLLLIGLMAVGGCAGSTAGGLKIIRVVMLCKSAFREIKKIVHPRSVSVVNINGEPVQDKALTGALHFFVIYILVIVVAMLLVSLNNMGFDTTFSSVLACISNTGPGFGIVGPASNYSGFSVLSKLVLLATMMTGRLEIYPILMLVVPASWRKA